MKGPKIVPPQTTDEQLLEEIHEALVSLVGIREAYATENTKRDKRIRTNNRLVRWAIAAAVIGLIVGGLGIFTGVQAQFASHDAKQASSDAKKGVHDAEKAIAFALKQADIGRVNGCDLANDQQDVAIAAEKAEIRKFIAALTPAPTPPDIKARIAAFLPGYDATVVASHKHLDCSIAAIHKRLHIQSVPAP